MKLLVVVQARTGSTRLPGKILLPLAGEPLLVRMIERLRAAETPFDLVVATTTDSADDAVAALAERTGTRVFRGHPTDLLDRHLMAARGAGADVVVKIPSDCPIIDPAIVDEVLGFFLASPGRWDFASNLHPPSWPDGNDVEVVTRDALETAHREATKAHEREHTTPFVWDRPERFRVGNVKWKSGRDLSQSHRFTIDYPEDYAFLSAVFDALYDRAHPVFSLDRILTFLDARPDVLAINARWAGVNWYRHHLADLKTVSAADTRSPE